MASIFESVFAPVHTVMGAPQSWDLANAKAAVLGIPERDRLAGGGNGGSNSRSFATFSSISRSCRIPLGCARDSKFKAMACFRSPG